MSFEEELLAAHKQLVDFVNKELTTNEIKFRGILCGDENDNADFHPNNGYPLINVYRADVNKAKSVDVEMCLILHEFGHFISFRDKLTSYQHNTNPSDDMTQLNTKYIIIYEELTAWMEAFRYLLIIPFSDSVRNHLLKMFPDEIRTRTNTYLNVHIDDSPLALACKELLESGYKKI